MPEHTDFSRVLLLAVDMWRYGSRDGRQQAELQQALSDAVSAAAAASGLDRSSWRVQDGGDGFHAEIDDGKSELALVGPFVRELDARLARFNAPRRPETRLRLRLALHHGGSLPAAYGFASDGPVHVHRLLDSTQARAVLAALPEANLVQIVSAPIFDGCVRQCITEVSETEFVRIRVDMPDKDFHDDAWLRVPGVSATTVADLIGPEPLLLGLRCDPATPGFVDRVLRSSFAAARIAFPDAVHDDGRNITMSLPTVTRGEHLLGVWLHHLGGVLDAVAPGSRIIVGVATGREHAVVSGLIGRAAAAGLPAGTVVVVSGDVHRQLVAGSTARMVMPESYRPLGTEPESWIRVLGYSVPPKPTAPREEASAPAAAPRIGVAHGPVSHIESGTFHGPFVVGSWHDNRGADR
ncbi:hypothetical protein [Amycolatopsis sp. cmx-4-61]|uniref:hypothetical protein n=1 Tax=Amycolatopsis sp. cmx-4-61 TaxID=2790937 RepID=UPI00397DDE33